MTVEGSHFDDARPERMADLLSGTAHAQVTWTPREIEAIYRHQLATPLQVELGALPATEAKTLTGLADAGGLLLKSIGDLLHHPHPPATLLTMLKDFAKRLMEHPQSPLPRDVASLLYWAAIASGLAHGGRRLTSLTNDRLLEGFRWAASQSWVDATTVELIRSAEHTLTAGGGSSG
jgi:hypothetical protein